MIARLVHTQGWTVRCWRTRRSILDDGPIGAYIRMMDRSTDLRTLSTCSVHVHIPPSAITVMGRVLEYLIRSPHPPILPPDSWHSTPPQHHHHRASQPAEVSRVIQDPKHDAYTRPIRARWMRSPTILPRDRAAPRHESLAPAAPRPAHRRTRLRGGADGI